MPLDVDAAEKEVVVDDGSGLISTPLLTLAAVVVLLAVVETVSVGITTSFAIPCL